MRPDNCKEVELEMEIQELLHSPLVKLARAAENVYRRHEQLRNTLREYERKGRLLQAAGITMEMLVNEDELWEE